ncbi:hypothetical protein S245_062520, partial [Arachis hypogaea]
DIYRLGHRFDFFRMLLCLLFDDSRILCNVKYARAKGDNALKAARILLKLHNLLFTITDEQSCMVVQNTEQAGAVLWSSMRSSPRTKGCTQEKSLCERAAAFDLVFTLRFYSTRHRGTEHPSFSAPNFSVSNSIPSGQVTLSSSTESDKEKRVQKLSRENEIKHSSGKAIRPGKRFKLRFLLAILILLRYHQISKKSRFKLCQKPFAERKFEDQDQDWIENQSPQHSIQVGLSIQVVRRNGLSLTGYTNIGRHYRSFRLATANKEHLSGDGDLPLEQAKRRLLLLIGAQYRHYLNRGRPTYLQIFDLETEQLCANIILADLEMQQESLSDYESMYTYFLEQPSTLDTLFRDSFR